MMMWNVKDCHVGFDKDTAKQFLLQGHDAKDHKDLLPKLNVDEDIPYTKAKRQSQQPRSFSQVPMAKTMTAWNPTVQDLQMTSH